MSTKHLDDIGRKFLQEDDSISAQYEHTVIINGDEPILVMQVESTDLGLREGLMVMNFNYAYNPSCSYNYRWVCPLAQPESKVDFEIPVGEKIWGL